MYYIIVNPASKSGKGAKIWSIIELALMERNIPYKTFFSKNVGHVIKIVRDLYASVLNKDDCSLLKLIVLGGDGTLNETIQGIADFSKVQIGYIPTGSSNDMARDLQLPKNPVQTLEHILNCTQPIFLDLGCLTYNDLDQGSSRQSGEELLAKRYFCVSSGIGFDAAVCEEALASKFKHILNKIGLGKLTYMAIALKQIIAAKKVSCDICLDENNSIHHTKFLFATGMIHQYEGGGFKFCPGADCHDGLIDICLIGNLPKLLLIAAIPTAFWGKHYLFKGIEGYKAQKITVTTSSPLWVHTDGEVSTKSSSITITCEKEKLMFLY